MVPDMGTAATADGVATVGVPVSLAEEAENSTLATDVGLQKKAFFSNCMITRGRAYLPYSVAAVSIVSPPT